MNKNKIRLFPVLAGLLLLFQVELAYALDLVGWEDSRRGGRINVVMANKPPHLNPAIQSGVVTMSPGAQLFASLLRMDQKWKLHPYLAKSWDVSEDGMLVTFHLRRGATFHDGMPITSADVAFSLETVQKHHPFSTMLRAMDRVETPDPHTVAVHLKQPHPALLTVAASPMAPILPKHVYGDGRDIKTHPANWDVVGSGPFKLVAYDDGQLLMDRHDGFFMPGRPFLDGVTYKKIGEETVVPAFKAGAVHLNGSISDIGQLNLLAKTPHLKLTRKGYAGIGPLQWLAFNLEKPPFNALKVRQAIAYAIDRDFLVQTLFDNHAAAKIATGPISPGSPFYSDDVEKYDLDVARANRLLDEAGYPRDATGVRFSTNFTFSTTTSEVWHETVEYLRMDLLNKIGVELKPQPMKSFADFTDMVANRKFTLALDDVFNWADPVIGVHRTYSSANIRDGVMWSNTQGYRNPEVDRLMELAGQEMDTEKRKALYLEFQRIVARDLPVYWLVELPSTTIYHKNLIGVDDTIWGNMFPFDKIYWQSGEEPRTDGD